MAIPPGELPDAAQALVDGLVHRGYTVKSERYDEAIFGNFVIVAGHGETAIRVIRDRGQLFVDIASLGSGAENEASGVSCKFYRGMRIPSLRLESFVVVVNDGGGFGDAREADHGVG